MHAVPSLPPLCVTVQVRADAALPAALARRGRRTVIVCEPGMTRAELRRSLGDALRPEELALVRRCLLEPHAGPLPPRLEDHVLQDGQLFIFHRDDPPRSLDARMA